MQLFVVRIVREVLGGPVARGHPILEKGHHILTISVVVCGQTISYDFCSVLSFCVLDRPTYVIMNRGNQGICVFPKNMHIP